MIYGNIKNKDFESQIAVLPPALAAAISYLKENDLASHEPGRFDIELGGVPMVLQVLDLATAPRKELRPEIHRTNIDVQFLASGGPELAGFYSDNGQYKVQEDLLDTPRDILFYENDPAAPEGRILLTPGVYAIYFPWDVHIPAIQAEAKPAPIRKIVIKVPLSACFPKGGRA